MQIIKSFNIDTSNIRMDGESKNLTITANNNAVFSMEILKFNPEGADFYYNFQTNLFQATKTRLSNHVVSGGVYRKTLKFPSGGGSAQKYEIFLFAEKDTKHDKYKEVRFLDGSMDINSTVGSNSRLMKKEIYQTADVTITIAPYSPSGTVTGSATNTSVVTPVGHSRSKIPFNFKIESAATAAFSIKRQPVASDAMVFIEATVGQPVNIHGENVYPTVNASVATVAVTQSSTTVDTANADISTLSSSAIKLGAKITSPVTTDTVNGARNDEAAQVTMDSAVAIKMSVGDQVTGNTVLDAGIFTVASLDSTNVFSLSEAVAIADGTTLTFSPKINRLLVTVAAFPSDQSAFTASQAIAVKNDQEINFSNSRNHRWELSSTSEDLSKIQVGMLSAIGTGVFGGNKGIISDYLDQTTIFENELGEYKVENVKLSAIDLRAIKPVISRDNAYVTKTIYGSSNNPIHAIFSEQAFSFFSGSNAKLFSYGNERIKSITNYDLEFTDLKVVLSPVVTQTSSSTIGSSSTTVAVDSRNGIVDGISTVSGLGISALAVNPTVSSGAGSVSGAGSIVLSAAQELEDNTVLTIGNTSRIATITGNIKIKDTGDKAVTLRFDVEKFLTMH